MYKYIKHMECEMVLSAEAGKENREGRSGDTRSDRVVREGLPEEGAM